MSNSHPAVLLGKKVDANDTDLDSITSNLANLNKFCLNETEPTSNKARINVLETEASRLNNAKAEKSDLSLVKTTADTAEQDLNNLVTTGQVHINTIGIGSLDTHISNHDARLLQKASKSNEP